MGCGILTTYAQISNIAGLHGLLVYTICASLPVAAFGVLGPILRKKCPDGFILSEWVRQRYGFAAAIYLSFFTCFTMFLYMMAELSAIRGAIETLTNLNALGAVIVQCGVTTIYTSIGGFSVSFITDNFQGAFVIILIIICAAGMGTHIDIDTSTVGPSGLLDANKLGWQLIYILLVAIGTNCMFLNSFWLRTFASKSDNDLRIGTFASAFIVFIVLSLVGSTGFLAVWSGDLTIGDPQGAYAFYILLAKMPRWVVGFVLIFVISLSTCAFDSLQSAMVSTISNDFLRNKLQIIYIRVLVVLIIIPIVVLAVKVADNILQIYLIADLLSSAIVPVLFLGLSDRFFWFLNGFDIIIGGLGALVAVFIFGTVYYGTAKEGGRLLLIWNGLYNSDDWGPFGAFVIAPVGGIVIAFISVLVRALLAYCYCKIKNKPFTNFDRPQPVEFDNVSVQDSHNGSDTIKLANDAP